MALETTSNQKLSLHKVISDLSSKLVFSSPEEQNLKLGQLQDALTLAVDVHKEQMRKDGEPYVNHLLRVTQRLTEEYRVTDTDVVMAALLHDSVEDQTDKLCELGGLPASRANAYLYLGKRFGNRVSYLVENLSEEETVEEVSDEEWNRMYAQHVQDIIEKHPDLLFIKLSDFSDNALTLSKLTDPEKRLKLSQKYILAMQIFLQKIEGTNALPREAQEKVSRKLRETITETETYLAVHR